VAHSGRIAAAIPLTARTASVLQSEEDERGARSPWGSIRMALAPGFVAIPRTREARYIRLVSRSLSCRDIPSAVHAALDLPNTSIGTLRLLLTVVSNPAANRLEAEHAAYSLADGIPEIEAILLFGSVARETAQSGSDIDLMAISSDPLRGTSIRSQLQDHPRVSLVTHTWETLERVQREDWSFFVHLHEEGKLLYGSQRLPEQLAKVRRPLDEDWRSPLHAELRSLSRFNDLDTFDGHYGFVLSHLFITARRTCMLDNTAAGEISFDRDQAFDTYRDRHPELAEEAACVRAIWPFQARNQGRKVPLPFSPDDASEVDRALACVRRIVGSTING
jgi:predicted nucleotidyltransferase